MGALEEYLTFTMETEDDFENGLLPTLDTEVKVTPRNIIEYRSQPTPTLSSTLEQPWQRTPR